MQSLQTNGNAIVIGASGGIGAAVLSQLRALGMNARGLSRRSATAIDITDDASVEAAAATCDAPLDLVFLATGLLHDETLQPEKTLRSISAENLERVLRINTVGPALVAKHFLPRMRKGQKTVFAALSARVGSISDNRLGGWASYRASKAALNMLLKTFAIEHRRQFPHAVVTGLHPGTVDTPLSAPFQRGVPDGKLFTPAFSAEQLLRVLDQLGPDDSGNVYAWDGQRVEF